MGKQERSPKALRALVQDTRTYTVTQGQLTQTHMTRHTQLHSCLAYQHTRHSRTPLRAQQVFSPGSYRANRKPKPADARHPCRGQYSEKQCTTETTDANTHDTPHAAALMPCLPAHQALPDPTSCPASVHPAATWGHQHSVVFRSHEQLQIAIQTSSCSKHRRGRAGNFSGNETSYQRKSEPCNQNVLAQALGKEELARWHTLKLKLLQATFCLRNLADFRLPRKCEQELETLARDSTTHVRGLSLGNDTRLTKARTASDAA